jgi:hypothetical protein
MSSSRTRYGASHDVAASLKVASPYVSGGPPGDAPQKARSSNDDDVAINQSP